MAHTPGPWKAYAGRQKHKEAMFITAGPNNFVGKAYGHDGQPVYDNAVLIAAAPELLGALEKLTGCLSTNMLDQNNAREYWTTAITAIYHAKGGEG